MGHCKHLKVDYFPITACDLFLLSYRYKFSSLEKNKKRSLSRRMAQRYKNTKRCTKCTIPCRRCHRLNNCGTLTSVCVERSSRVSWYHRNGNAFERFSITITNVLLFTFISGQSDVRVQQRCRVNSYDLRLFIYPLILLGFDVITGSDTHAML